MSNFLEMDKLSVPRYEVAITSLTDPLPSEASLNDSSLFHETVRDRGWALIFLNLENVDDLNVLKQWQEVFSKAFLQTTEEKVMGGKYRSVKNLPVGFRKDDEREFFETRVFKESDGKVAIAPCYGSLFEKTVRLLFTLQRRVAIMILRTLAAGIGLHPDSIIDLTDLKDILNVEGQDPDGASVKDDSKVRDVSSSLLRVCSYPALDTSNNELEMGERRPLTDTDSNDTGVVFGSHTDTSVLTLGLCSDVPGLELYDRKEKKWINGEMLVQKYTATGESSVPLIVFVGEVLQVLTRAYYRATIHRVRAPLHGTRVSCPFIIRGKWGRIVNMRNGLSIEHSDETGKEVVEVERTYDHPGGMEVLKKYTPDLDGSDISLLHKILDLKRAKCRKRNENSTADWVLAAELELLEDRRAEGEECV